MRRQGLTAAVLAFLTLLATTTHAALFTTDQASFLAANPALALEDFEGANLAAGTDNAFLGPLSSTTNNAIFATGSVIDGFELSPTGGDIYVSRDFGGNAGVNVSSNQFTADINIVLLPGVTA